MSINLYLLPRLFRILTIAVMISLITRVSGQEPEGSQIAFYRFVEDYSYLKDNQDSSFWESFKYMPLGNSAYVSLGGELRLYHIVEDNEWWNTEINTDNFSRLRAMLHADFHFGSGFRVFSQLLAAGTVGTDDIPIPPDTDTFDIQQFFAEYRFPLSKSSKSSFVRIGRQELNIGGHQLLKVREGLNARLSFDALRFHANLGNYQIDAFQGRPVTIEEGALDNPVYDDALDFWGVNVKRGFFNKTMVADFYYFGYLRDFGIFEQASGEELRHTVGGRATWRKGAFDFDYEFSYQFGALDGPDLDIRAFGFATFTGYTFENLPWQPRFIVKMSYTSGDDDTNDTALNSFNPLFPRGNYFGETATLTGINIINPGLGLELFPKANHRFRADWELLWRESTSDGLYIPPSIFFQASEGSNARYIGSLLTSAYYIGLNPFTEIVLVYSHFFTDDFIEEVITSESTNFFSARVQFKF